MINGPGCVMRNGQSCVMKSGGEGVGVKAVVMRWFKVTNNVSSSQGGTENEMRREKDERWNQHNRNISQYIGLHATYEKKKEKYEKKNRKKDNILFKSN